MERQDAPSQEQVLRRIRGEFIEMPGLWLTCSQAERLWALERGTGRALLDALVEARFLRRGRNGAYGRAA